MARSRAAEPRRARPAVRLQYQADPLGQSVRRLNTKWTLLVLRDMAFLHHTRFSEFLRNNPGLTPRVLSRRLREMRAEGLVVRTGSGRSVSYRMTAQGEDAVFILLAFLRYGLKYHASGAPGGSDLGPGRAVATRPRPGYA